MATSRRIFVTGGLGFLNSGSTMIVPNTFVEILSFVVPSGVQRKLSHVELSCRSEGLFQVLEDSAVIGSGRSAPGEPNPKFDWAPGHDVSEGSTIKVQFKALPGTPANAVEAYLMGFDS